MTRADLTEELCQAIELPKKESDVVVCTIFDSIVRAMRSGDKVEIRGFGSFRAKDERASDGIQKPERESKRHRRRYPSSNLARHLVMPSSESEQGTVFG